jgi:hypothetical protein
MKGHRSKLAPGKAPPTEIDTIDLTCHLRASDRNKRSRSRAKTYTRLGIDAIRRRYAVFKDRVDRVDDAPTVIILNNQPSNVNKKMGENLISPIPLTKPTLAYQAKAPIRYKVEVAAPATHCRSSSPSANNPPQSNKTEHYPQPT